MLRTNSELTIEDRVRELEREVLHLKEREATLIKSENRLRHLFNGARDAIFITDADGNFVDINDGATSLTGYSKQELNGMSIENLHDAQDLASLQKTFAQIMQGESVTFETKIRLKDGSHADIECSNRRILVHEIPYVHMVARDIT